MHAETVNSGSDPLYYVEMSAEFSPGSHVVAVIGGSTAGAEVAARLGERGVKVAVFEMNPRPFGKIEDGLPRWHAGLRNKEYGLITSKLASSEVSLVPNTKIGRDVQFSSLVEDWGFSAIVLATGAWSDRPLSVEGAEQWVGKGLTYQNPFIIYFNHLEEEGSAHEVHEFLDDALVIGGGLASIDCAKVLMLETTRARLAERGIEVELGALEMKGIPKVLEANALTFGDLGLEGCTLFYRRRVEDMPLNTIPEGADDERVAKMRATRRKLLDRACAKYCFAIEELSSPDALLTEDDHVVGMRMGRTEIRDGRVVSTGETYERRGSCVISSIGSIPEVIPGVRMNGELFAFADRSVGRIEGFPNLFAVGNAVTGQGNVVASRRHASAIVDDALESFLGLSEDGHGSESVLSDGLESHATRTAEAVAASLQATAPPSAAELEATLARVRERQQAVGYDGDLHAWLAEVAPKPRTS